MNNTPFTKEQESAISKFHFLFGMLNEGDLVLDVLSRLCDSIPNNYDLGTIIRDLVTSDKLDFKKNKIS
jgi:hypothetical protein